MTLLRDEILLKKIGAKIKRLREQKGVTQEEAFNDTSIHFGRIESANTNLTVSTLNAICKYFGITLADFFKAL